MSRYLVIHKDHPLSVNGVNSGAEMATLHLARFLAKRGFEVFVAAQLRDGEQTVDGVQFWDLGEDYDVEGAVERIRSYGEYHLISAGRFQPFLFTREDSLCLTKFLISHDRSGNDTGISPAVLCHYVDKIICVSDAQREVFVEAGVPEEKLQTVRNGVDHELFPIGQTEERNWNRLVFVGALVQDKGLDLLLIAYAELKAKYPNLTLDVYGSADLWGRGEIFDQADLQARLPGLTFHGKVPQGEVSKAFQTAGVCVVPSIWFDPFPLTAIEAQVTGCPVVTFDVGGLKEGVRDRETGRVLTEITPDELTKALDELLEDKGKLVQMANSAIAKQRPYFTWDRVVDEITNLQGEILESKTERTSQDTGFTVGVMTTWNQRCGLATYASSLCSRWSKGSYAIFGEKTEDSLTAEDESFVSRCWSWQTGESAEKWTELVSEVKESGVGVLLVNAHNPKQLADSHFEQAMDALSESGIPVVLLLHTVFTLRVAAKSTLQKAAHIITLSPELKLEVASYGVPAEKISVVPLGIEVLPELTSEERVQALSQLGLPKDKPVISSIGFIQPHKGLEALIETVRVLSDEDLPIHACIAGRANNDDPDAVEYKEKLHSLSQYFGLSDQVTFLDRYLTDDEVSNLLRASDAVIMNYRSTHYECSAACAQALGANARVITSLAAPFQPFGSAVWHATEGFSVPLAVRELIRGGTAAELLDGQRKQFVQAHRWEKLSPQIFSLLGKFSREDKKPSKGFERFTETKKKEQPVTTQPTSPSKKVDGSLRVLIQNRSNMFSQRGGDTIVIEQLMAGLLKRGITADLDLEGKKDPSQYDLVHLINFALPQMIDVFGQRAHEANVPFVVTTLCEDVPRFHNQSRQLAETLVYYQHGGQQKDWLAENFDLYRQVPASASFDNSWGAQHAARLIVNGAGEERVINSTYPGHAPVSVVPVGYEVMAEGSREAFVQEYGIEDFVLCVGRLESRKNQLMLALAMEELDLPLVFAAGGFSYQPDYAEAIRGFQRKGKTLVVERLSADMLASAYKAAKVHALPSWYELPGLVTLEAATFGCNVVASDTGTTRDYLGDFGFYCEPDSIESIRNAVIAAYYSPQREGLSQHVRQFTWDAAAEATIRIYEEVANKRVESTTVSTISTLPAEQSVNSPVEALAVQTVELSESQQLAFDELARQGFEAAQQKDFDTAHQTLAKAEELNPNALRVLCNRAAVYLAEENPTAAKGYFERARQVDSTDNKAQSGYAMCLMMEGNKEDAHGHFLQVLEREPNDMMAILQLLDCSYALDRYDDLERVLKRLLLDQPENFDMRYCLAGCLIRQSNLEEALSQVELLLAERPQHGGSLELKQAIEEMKNELSAEATPAEQTHSTSSAEEQLSPIDRAIEKVVDNEVATPQLAQPFDSIDVRLGELEELKHRKELNDAMEGVEELLQRSELAERHRNSSELLKGEILALQGERDEALAIFKAHHERDELCPRAMCGIAAIAASYNELAEAKELFHRALNSAPLYDKALAGVGFCEYFEGNYPESWDYYLKALDANPENLSALLGIIQLGYQLQRLPELQGRLESYLEMHPADLDIVYAYAGCIFAQGQLSEALGEVEKILLFRPEDARAQELRDVIEEKLQGKSLAV